MGSFVSTNSIIFVQILASLPIVFQPSLFSLKDLAKTLTERRRSIIRRLFYGLLALKIVVHIAGRVFGPFVDEEENWTLVVISLALFVGWDKWIRSLLMLNRVEEELEKSHLESKERMEHDERIVELEEEIQDLMEELKTQHSAAKEYEAQLKERQKQFFHKIRDHAKTLTDTLQETEQELQNLRLDGIHKEQILKEKDDELDRLKSIILDWQKKYNIGDQGVIKETMGDGVPPTPTKDPNHQKAIQDAIEALRHFDEEDATESSGSKKTFPEEDDKDKSPKDQSDPSQFPASLQHRGKKTKPARDVFNLWRS